MGEDMLMRKLLELPNGEYELVGWALASAAFCRFNVLGETGLIQRRVVLLEAQDAANILWCGT